MAVYFIRRSTDGKIKIGFATDAKKRLALLQQHFRHLGFTDRLSIVRLLEGTKKDEAQLHKRFRELREIGEWFTFSDDMLTQNFGLADLEIPKTRKRYEPKPARVLASPPGPHSRIDREALPHIARRLRLLRLALKKSQKEFSSENGFTKSSWNAWETGRGRINLDDAMKLFHRYGVSLVWIYLGDYGVEKFGADPDTMLPRHIRNAIEEIEKQEGTASPAVGEEVDT
jgi:transcriptional regulator with XRE-family HTH domain